MIAMMSQPEEPKTTQSDEIELAENMRQETSRSLSKETRKVVILIVVVAAFMVIAHFTNLRAWITNVQIWKGYVRDLGWVAHGCFSLVCAGAVLMGVPRLPLCAGAGLIFGFGQGLALSLAGSTLGSYGAFLMSRAGARHALLARTAQWPWLRRLLDKPSLLRVFWVRQLLLPGIVLNVMLGITAVSHRVFLIGTLLGYLPLNIAFALVGSGLGKGSLPHTLMQLLAAMAVVNLAAWLVWRTVSRYESVAV